MREGEGHSAAGQSIIEMLWEQAVLQYDKLTDLHEKTGGVDDNLKSPRKIQSKVAADYLRTQGKLLGLCYSLALMLNPYDIDIDAVKKQVREQWDAEYGEEEDEEE